jgi:hypothetical protein
MSTPSIKNQDQTGTAYGIRRLDTDSGTLKDNTPVVALSDMDGHQTSVQYPIPTDGDSVYYKDVDWSLSDVGSFTGDLTTLFSDYHESIVDSTATDPKYFVIHFFRPILTTQLGLGSPEGGNFSNVKIIAKDESDTTRLTLDDSANDTKYTSNIYYFKDGAGSLTSIALIELRVEFHTTDAVNIIGSSINKVNVVDALIKGLDDSTGLPTYAKLDNGEFIVGGQVRIKNGDNTTIDDDNPFPTKLYAFENGSTHPVRLDASTEALMTLDYEHHEIHAGSHFTIRGWQDITAATTDFLVITPDTTKWMHIIWSFATEAEFEFYLYEAPTTTADGTPITGYNNNRNSATAPTLMAYSAPTVTVVGTNIWSGKTGAGKLAGGESRNESELVLKQNTKYLFRFLKIAAGTVWLDYDFKWYEHTDRN